MSSTKNAKVMLVKGVGNPEHEGKEPRFILEKSLRKKDGDKPKKGNPFGRGSGH